MVGSKPEGPTEGVLTVVEEPEVVLIKLGVGGGMGVRSWPGSVVYKVRPW